MQWFLAAQLIACRAMDAARAGDPTPEEGEALAEMIAALDADCRSRGQAPLPDLPASRPLDTLAVGYLTLGSRAGTTLLARRATEAGCPLPRAFELPPAGRAWRDFRARLDRVDPTSHRAQRIVQDARAGFDLHRAAAALAWTMTRDDAHDDFLRQSEG
ncbi:hypothetical protein [Roseivivax halodurans]|uniref:hypothetical protein n=1 Tax=Roseivivax halodurans TaxID=93683 RepID=UPI0012F7D0C9|nr:hypothetical protein [Roseivivax halodurans]